MHWKACLFLVCAINPLQLLASNCREKELVLVEVDRNNQVSYDGKVVKQKDELEGLRQHCAKNIVVFMHPDAKIRKVADFAFYSSKLGMTATAENFFVFIESLDKSRLIFVPTMASVRYPRDEGALKRLIAAPPSKDDFL